MNRVFIWTMRRMPQIMTGAAVVFYFSTVVVTLAAGSEISRLGMETLPTIVMARIFVTIFIQPLVGPLLLLFGAALLWRIDCWRGATE